MEILTVPIFVVQGHMTIHTGDILSQASVTTLVIGSFQPREKVSHKLQQVIEFLLSAESHTPRK
eukprot:5161503-Amphidinium_carterae.1